MKNILKKFVVGAIAMVMLPFATEQALGAESTEVVKESKEYIGVPYQFGGSSPTAGFDCSGFIKYVLDQVGVDVPRTSAAQSTIGTSISKNELKPGDLIFFENTYKPGISHSGFYIGNNQFISATSSGIKIDSMDNPYWAPRFVKGARLSGVSYELNFPDLAKDHQAYNAIMALADEKVINGFDNGQFRPESPVTRGQAAAIINRVLKLDGSGVTNFPDVSPNLSFAKDIAAIKKAGIIQGFTNGTFQPSSYMTRAEMALIVDRAFELKGNSAHIASVVYSDIATNYHAYSAISALYASDKTSVFKTPTFRATDRATRADFAAAIYSAK